VRLVTVLFLLLCGCATSYQNLSFTGGFTEVRLAEDVYRVTFHGNGYSSKNRAADLNLLRCAELTLEAGFTHFITVDSDEYVTNQTYYTPTTTTGNFSANTRVTGYGNTAYGSTSGSFRSNTYGGQPITFKKPSSENVILMLTEKPKETFAYDAMYLVKSLSASYGIEIQLDELEAAKEKRSQSKQQLVLESHRSMAREIGATMLCTNGIENTTASTDDVSEWLLDCGDGEELLVSCGRDSCKLRASN